MVYNIEKMLKDGGDKIQGPEKSEVESVLAESKKVLEGTPNSSELKAAHEKLTQASHKLAEVMYKANAAAAGAAGGPDGSAGGAGGRAEERRRRDRRRVRGRGREEVGLAVQARPPLRRKYSGVGNESLSTPRTFRKCNMLRRK